MLVFRYNPRHSLEKTFSSKGDILMSFVKTLGLLAVGFVAAKGVDKFKKSGGMEGMKDALRKAGDEGGMADQLGEMAEKFGMPGGKDQVRKMMGQFGSTAADATEATEAGLGNLMTAMTGAATAGAAGLGDMFGALTEGTAIGQMSEDNAKLMIRAMIQAAKSDGEIDEEERTKILDHLGDASEEEIAFVQGALDAPVDPAALAQDVGEGAKAQVYSSALMAISVDTEAERQYLKGLAMALQLDDTAVAQIHSTMGKPMV